MPEPVIIQGGMGVAVSSWPLARAVGRSGHLGVVSGTALDAVHARRLGDGDPGGHLRRAYAAFPVPDVAARVLDRYFVAGGRPPGSPYRRVPRFTAAPGRDLVELTVLANFAEVWLAREGHDGPIGVNYLEKVQFPTPYAIYGAMLAGVEYVLMGAGIPKDVPALLSTFAAGHAAQYRLTVVGAGPDDTHAVSFDPSALFGAAAPALVRPRFLAIIASNTLATFLTKNPAHAPDGFVVEGASAGGHNAPPRGRLELDAEGQPVYGPRDVVDLDALARVGLPFWLAGECGDPARLREALVRGAAGVQVGTAFALCHESGIDPAIKRALIDGALAGDIAVRTDPVASPSGYPFKVVSVAGSVADPDVYGSRRRVCDLGFLRTAYLRDDGRLGYRCAAEPVSAYVRKGGSVEESAGRACLCNGLLATVGLAQVRDGVPEPPIVTAGDDLVRTVRALAPDGRCYSAADVIAYLLSDASRAGGATVTKDPVALPGTSAR